jgi:transcriptional regulator with PAS, ATPase and Fis domain
MKTLVITGWGGTHYLDYACAAALALRALPKSEVVAVSKERLPKLLAEFAAVKSPPFMHIIILGISPNVDCASVLESLNTLVKKNVKITWISAIKYYDHIKESLEVYTTLHCVDKKYITLATADFFQIEPDNLLPLLELAPSPPETLKTPQAYPLLIKAVQHRHRLMRDDDSAVADAIRSIATLKPLTKEQEKICNFYIIYGARELRGKSNAMALLRQRIETIGPKNTTRILICGETGTGKETVAIMLHHKSHRVHAPFITFNCASSSTQLLESQLFGYEKGAFTGAVQKRDGAFHYAEGGTLFLDEIGELTLDIQANLLRVLQENRFTRLGSVNEEKCDIAIIAATNRNLKKMVDNGKFREDLFYRINVVTIHLPPLRDRLEDIDDIAYDFWFTISHQRLPQENIHALKSYHWPGNIRELINFLERAYVNENDDFAHELDTYKNEFNDTTYSKETLTDNLEECIRAHILRIYEKYDKNKTHAANALGVSRTTLNKYL